MCSNRGFMGKRKNNLVDEISRKKNSLFSCEIANFILAQNFPLFLVT